jgi:cytochrome c oxidase assembly factor CtaG
VTGATLMSVPRVSFTDWEFQPTVLAGLAVILAVYALALRGGWLRRDDDLRAWSLGPRRRAAIFGLGLAIWLVALCSPIDTISDNYLLWVHMIQHILLMMVAPPLLVLGVAGAPSPPARFLPRLRRLWTGVTRPIPAYFIFNADLLVWHWPAFYDATLANENLHTFEHLTFMFAGVVLWWAVIDPLRGPAIKPISSVARILLLALSGLPSTVLGLLFAIAPAPFYSFYALAPRLWGMSALTDQQLAGVVMLVAGVLVGFAGISAVFLHMLGSPEADELALHTELPGAAGPSGVRPVANAGSR